MKPATIDSSHPLSLIDEGRHSGIAIEDALQALVAAVREQHGSATQAVLFYGSCLRSGDPATGIADFYVLVDEYRQAGMGWLSAGLNRLLPPNVFYLETSLAGHTLRAKYAVVRYDQFIKGVTGGWLLPYLWGRFAQPHRIAWANSDHTQHKLTQAVEQAAPVFLQRASASLHGDFSFEEIWQQALMMSYRTELRAERIEKIQSLVHADPAYYEGVTPAILQGISWIRLRDDGRYLVNPSHGLRAQARWAWRLRMVLGKFVSILRLFKSLFTFSGAVDYAVWKIQRHSGQKVEVPDWARRYPWIGAWVVVWRLYRRGQLR